MGMRIINPGILSLLQDAGRYGKHGVGLTTGGPLDPVAFKWANRLVDNELTATAIEISIGGFKAELTEKMNIAVTGAKAIIKVNGKPTPQWQTLQLNKSDVIEVAYASQGCRIYLAVSGGFDIKPQFGSTSTVVREAIGGVNGKPIEASMSLPVAAKSVQNKAGQVQLYKVPQFYRPDYSQNITLRVIPGYQIQHFSRHQQRMFFYHEYEISDLADRMGYRLKGPKVKCDIEGILSEGICLGAIQVPADGQPIILMNDRQTIGGYPKIGSVLSLDLAKLSQLTQGAKVCFEPITIDHAHNLLHLAQHQFEHAKLAPVEPYNDPS